MGSGDGQVTGSFQKILWHSHHNSRVSLEASGASHPQDGGLLRCMGRPRRGTATTEASSYCVVSLFWTCYNNNTEKRDKGKQNSNNYKSPACLKSSRMSLFNPAPALLPVYGLSSLQIYKYTETYTSMLVQPHTLLYTHPCSGRSTRSSPPSSLYNWFMLGRCSGSSVHSERQTPRSVGRIQGCLKLNSHMHYPSMMRNIHPAAQTVSCQ